MVLSPRSEARGEVPGSFGMESREGEEGRRRGVRGWIRAQSAPLPPDLRPQTELASMRLQVCDEDRASLYVEAGDAARYEMKETNEGTGTRSRK